MPDLRCIVRTLAEEVAMQKLQMIASVQTNHDYSSIASRSWGVRTIPNRRQELVSVTTNTNSTTVRSG